MINEGDIVPYIDQGFLPGTKITQIKSASDQLAINCNFPTFLRFLAKGYEAHIHHLAGREQVGYQSEVNVDEINQSKLRHWLHDTKWITNWLVFPLKPF